MPSRRRILHDSNRGERIDCPTIRCRCARAGVAAEVTGSPEAIAYWTPVWSEACQITTAAVVRHAVKRPLCRPRIGSMLFPVGDLAACQDPVPPVFRVDFAVVQSERSHGVAVLGSIEKRSSLEEGSGAKRRTLSETCVMRSSVWNPSNASRQSFIKIESILAGMRQVYRDAD